MSQLKKRGLIRKIAPRMYTSVEEKEVEQVVRSAWGEIVTNLFPHALLSHRSALEFKPTKENKIFLTSNTNREARYPGLTLVFIRGPQALKEDKNFLNFKSSCLERALLENLSSAADRCLPSEEVENRLERILHQQGEEGLNQLRDQAHLISQKLGWEKEFKKLNGLIGTLLGSHPTQKLSSSQAIARALGQPYDSYCLARLDILAGELRHYPFKEISEKIDVVGHFTNKAFFEAYFSNYIEGTTFEIEEAESIIFDKKIPEKRPQDAHDIIGTYAIVSDPNKVRKTPRHFSDFLVLLQSYHYQMMESRPEVSPGVWKDKPNRAGQTQFVDPEYVLGTLEKGFAHYQQLSPGLMRAIFIMFLVAEVHPFTDGNGRLARIMMNAELIAQNLVSIIIPNVYREDYVTALRAMSRRERATPLIDMLVKAQKFSVIDCTNYPKALSYIQKHNWFLEPNEAKLILDTTPPSTD